MHDTIPADKWVTMARRLIAIAAMHDEPSSRDESRPTDQAAENGESAVVPASEPAASVTTSAAPRRRRAAVRTAGPSVPPSSPAKAPSRKLPARKSPAGKSPARSSRRASAES